MTAAIVQINNHMRTLTIIALFICTSAWAGHSQNNGTCDDDITHWSNMINKRTDAPLHSKSLKMHELALKANSVWQCENYMEEALRMIRKDGDGNYATE